ncbi:hypothetical protein ABPG75_003022 [Micractinium tetrahymenae]
MAEGEPRPAEDFIPIETAPAAAAAAAVEAVPTPQHSRVRRREEPAEEWYMGGAVFLRRLPDGHVELEGAPLRHISPMLQHILHFKQQPAALRVGAQQQQQGGQQRWRSSWALDGRELQFVRDVLEHRRRKMEVGRGFDDKAPIPGGTVPLRFIPCAPDGRLMKGPYTTRNGMEHNMGRQFFSTFRSGWGEFLWADGTERESDEAFECNAAWAEDEGIVPPGMGRVAQRMLGLEAFLQRLEQAHADPFDQGYGSAGDGEEVWDEEAENCWGGEDDGSATEEEEEDEDEASEEEEEEEEEEDSEGSESKG